MNRHQRRQAYWQGKIREWAQSGQPVSAWCAEHGVSPGCFYLWRRRLQDCNGRQPDLPYQPSRAYSPLQVVQTMGSTSGYPMSSATVTPLIRHLRNPAGVIQANLRDQASGFSDQPGCSGHVWSARIGYPSALREKYYSMARLQGAQNRPKRHG